MQKKEFGWRPLVLIAIGLTAAGIWTNVSGYSSYHFRAEHAAEDISFIRTAFMFGRTFAGVIILVTAPRIPRIPTVPALMVALIMCSATTFLLFSFDQSLIDPTVFAAINALIGSAGYVFLVLIFYLALAQYASTEKAVASIGASLILETVLSVAIGMYAAQAVQMLLVIFMPLCMVGCYWLVGRYSRRCDPVFLTSQKAAGFTKVSLVATILLSGTTLVFIRALSSVGMWGQDRSNYLGIEPQTLGDLFVVSVIFAALAYFVFVLPRKHFSLLLRCIIGIVVMLTGFEILIVMGDNSAYPLIEPLTLSIELFAHLVLWMSVIECVRHAPWPLFRAGAINFPFNGLLSLLWVAFLERAGHANETFILVVLFALILCVLILLIGGNYQGDSPLWLQEQEDERALASFAELWKLTPRETEIFILLLQKKTRSDIEKECDLSQGTVKTHISRLYKKLDVHSRTEMASLYRSSQQQPGEPAIGNTEPPSELNAEPS